jgi:hypothetical protein
VQIKSAGECRENDESVWTLATRNDQPGHFDFAIDSDNQGSKGRGITVAREGVPGMQSSGGGAGFACIRMRELLVAEGDRELAGDVGESCGRGQRNRG